MHVTVLQPPPPFFASSPPAPPSCPPLPSATGNMLGRPSWLPVPEFALMTLLGEGASVVLEVGARGGLVCACVSSRQGGYAIAAV